MAFTLTFCLKSAEGKISSQGEAKCDLSKDSLTVLPKLGESLYFSLRDIVKASQENYKITLSLISNETLTLSDLGYQYEDFLRQLLKKRNVMVLSDELIKETPRQSFADIEYAYISSKSHYKGEAELKIYSDKLVVIPKDQEPIKIYLNEITKVENKDFSVSVSAGDIVLKLIKLGERNDQIVNALSHIINISSLSVQQALQELFPTVDSSIIRSAAQLLKEGRAAKKEDIEKISPKIWEEMEKKLAKLEIKEEYDYLTANAVKKTTAIGLRKEGGVEYLWFLVPIYDGDPKKPGNVIALESTTSEDNGKATYFFRIMGRKEYSQTKSVNEMLTKVNNILEEINDAMIKTNFKREPIYLPEEKIIGTSYEITLKKIPELKKLRECFIGRIIHNSTESWRTNVDSLLNFNINSVNDQEKWQK